MSKAIRRIPVAVWLGGALLAFSFGCVVWVVGLRAADDGAAPPKTIIGKAAGSYAYVDIESGVAKLYTLQPGRVVKIHKHDNDVVDKDAVLVELDDTLAKTDLATAQEALKAAEADLESAKALPAQHEEKIAGQTAAVNAKKAELEAAQQKRDEVVRQFNDHLGPRETDANAARATVRGYEEAVKIEEAKLHALQKYDPTIDVRKAEAQVTAKKELVKKAEFALRECTIKAPSKGTVLRILAAEGDVLGANPREPAVIFCPDQPRILRAEIEQEFASRLFVDQTALIRDDSTSSPQLTGKVTRISDWYSHRRSMVQEPLQFNDVRTVECIITLDPSSDKTPLRIGQRMRVTFEAKK